jgi:hypothetical protein
VIAAGGPIPLAPLHGFLIYIKQSNVGATHYRAEHYSNPVDNGYAIGIAGSSANTTQVESP